MLERENEEVIVVNIEGTLPEGTTKEISKPEKRHKKKKPYRWSGSAVLKALVFIFLMFFGFASIGSGFVCAYLTQEGYYELELNSILERQWYPETQAAADTIQDLLETGQLNKVLEFCQNENVDVELIWIHWDGKESVVWKTQNICSGEMQMDVDYKLDSSGTFYVNNHVMISSRDYLLRFFIDSDTSFQGIGKKTVFAYESRFLVIGSIALFGLLVLACFIFILFSAGRRKGRAELVPGILTRLYLEILTVLFAGSIYALWYGVRSAYRYVADYWIVAGVGTAAGIFALILVVLYFKDIVLRIKMGVFWRRSLIFTGLGILGKGVLVCCRGLWTLLKLIPSVVNIVIVFLVICLLELGGISVYVRETEGIILWGIEKVILFCLVMYVAGNCKKLLVAGRELAQGKENYRVDTSKLKGGFKEHGENLNSVGQGISKAVSERMKSEHLKTELISNVSHDLKTPLTSIINYADLICEEASEEENGKIREYAEVLLRQSRRLKKLLEDLMEAAKATTGNLEVHLMPCEVGVLLSQAAGEYQQKMEERELELIVRQPEQPVRIEADGRHLWRVFDNLLNNICKYAQEKSRIYLNVEVQGEQVQIIFRNMSKYALDISAEELEERFVRGDKSRHMEGNGLGLSIAKSLMDLQNGKMEIVIDGDLFKVILKFGVYTEQDEEKLELPKAESQQPEPKKELQKPQRRKLGIREVWNHKGLDSRKLKLTTIWSSIRSKPRE